MRVTPATTNSCYNRAFSFDPLSGPSGLVRAIGALANNAFQAHRARLRERRLRIFRKVLAVAQPAVLAVVLDQRVQQRAAHAQSGRAQVITIEKQAIECDVRFAVARRSNAFCSALKSGMPSSDRATISPSSYALSTGRCASAVATAGNLAVQMWPLRVNNRA